jgi:DNA-binding transcriptional LysR family regulator
MPNTELFDFVQLKRFIAVAECKSFRKAAERLNVTEPTISRSMLQLQNSLHLRLFQKGKAALLTKEGEQFLASARKIMQLLEDTQKEVCHPDQELRGKLILGCPRLIPCITKASDLLLCFHQRHPEVSFQLAVENPDLLIARLEEQTCDAAILMQQYTMPYFSSIPLFKERMTALIPAGDPLAQQTGEIEFTELLDRDLITSPAMLLTQEMNLWMKTNHVSLKIRCVTADAVSVIHLIRGGMGIGVFPESLQYPGLDSGICPRPIVYQGRALTFSFHLFWTPKNAAESDLTSRFLAFAREEARSVPGTDGAAADASE